jgi:glycosyltransferase involved in cell wall biosynthesis
MQDLEQHSTLMRPASVSESRPLIVVGITHAETCLVLSARLRALRAAGFRVLLICGPGPLLLRLAWEQEIEILPIPMERGISPFADVLSLWRLCKVLRWLRPSMTEFSTPKAGLLGNLAAKLCGVPVRVYLLRGLRLETLTGLKHRLLVAAERIASACAHYVVCNSESLRLKAVTLRITSLAKLQVIGNGSSQGVDIDRFSPGPERIRKSLGIPQDLPVIGFVGRLTRDKGIPELMEAFNQILQVVPKARLLLVGWFDESDDAVSEGLRRRIASHPQVVCTGLVADTAPYYRAMDLMVLPTWREGFPNVVLEAAASGIPVVTTISTGSRDAVIPEVTGLLIPAGYPQAIAEAVIRLIRNRDERFRMGRAARAWVIEQFVNGHVLGLTVGFYQKLLRLPAREDIGMLATDGAVIGE